MRGTPRHSPPEAPTRPRRRPGTHHRRCLELAPPGRRLKHVAPQAPYSTRPAVVSWATLGLGRAGAGRRWRLPTGAGRGAAQPAHSLPRRDQRPTAPGAPEARSPAGTESAAGDESAGEPRSLRSDAPERGSRPLGRWLAVAGLGRAPGDPRRRTSGRVGERWRVRALVSSVGGRAVRWSWWAGGALVVVALGRAAGRWVRVGWVLALVKGQKEPWPRAEARSRGPQKLRGEPGRPTPSAEGESPTSMRTGSQTRVRSSENPTRRARQEPPATRNNLRATRNPLLGSPMRQQTAKPERRGPRGWRRRQGAQTEEGEREANMEDGGPGGVNRDGRRYGGHGRGCKGLGGPERKIFLASSKKILFLGRLRSTLAPPDGHPVSLPFPDHGPETPGRAYAAPVSD